MNITELFYEPKLRHIDVSKNGELMLLQFNKELQMFDLPNKKMLYSAPNKNNSIFTISPDNDFLAGFDSKDNYLFADIKTFEIISKKKSVSIKSMMPVPFGKEAIFWEFSQQRDLVFKLNLNSVPEILYTSVADKKVQKVFLNNNTLYILDGEPEKDTDIRTFNINSINMQTKQISTEPTNQKGICAVYNPEYDIIVTVQIPTERVRIKGTSTVTFYSNSENKVFNSVCKDSVIKALYSVYNNKYILAEGQKELFLFDAKSGEEISKADILTNLISPQISICSDSRYFCLHYADGCSLFEIN